MCACREGGAACDSVTSTDVEGVRVSEWHHRHAQRKTDTKVLSKETTRTRTRTRTHTHAHTDAHTHSAQEYTQKQKHTHIHTQSHTHPRQIWSTETTSANSSSELWWMEDDRAMTMAHTDTVQGVKRMYCLNNVCKLWLSRVWGGVAKKSNINIYKKRSTLLNKGYSI